ncbi:MAG TPA: hypothetical protein VF212_00770, partial [Longimicrobiales bacterium]
MGARLESTTGAAGRGDAGSVAALGVVTLVLLFFLQAQRAYLASLFALVYDAVFPSFRPLGLAAAALPLAALVAPLASLANRLGHARTLLVATSLAAVARVVMVPAGLGPRLVGSSAVVAGAGLFLANAVGTLERRAVGAGAALAFTIDGLLRLAGWSYDPSLRPGWLVVQLVLSAAAIALAVRTGDADGAPTPDFERRAGGLRLRGGLMLGAILFFEASVLGSAPVGAQWTGVPYPLLAALLVVAGGVATALLLASREPAGR